MNPQTSRATPRRGNEPLCWPETASSSVSGVRYRGGGDRPGETQLGVKATGFIDDALDEIGRSDIAQTLLALADLAHQAASALVRAATDCVMDQVIR